MKEFERSVVPSESAMRSAIEQRDRSFDEIFVYGVITTGVYCLPSCAARPARPENLRFFLDVKQASNAGLRACKRCRPVDTRRERQQILDSARFIESHSDEVLTLATLARQIDLTPSRFQKLFKECIGVSPKAFQDAARLNKFKSSLRNGAAVGSAIFDAGFGSTSRVYGEATRNIGMSPSTYRAGGAGETIRFACKNSSFGPLMLAATDVGVCFAQFGESEESLLDQLRSEFPEAELKQSKASRSGRLNDWIEALHAHLGRGRPRPDVPLDIRGTAFQIKVWRFLLSVPDGDVISYSELAAGIDQPKAVRAAASACGANKVAVLIPCHRVLRGDGGIGGYRWGVERKRTLIDTERNRRSQS